MAILEPEIAILDEIDSGLDIDALRIVSEGINILVDQTHMGVLIITHYQRLLDYIKPQAVHVMMDGQIVRTGDAIWRLSWKKRLRLDSSRTNHRIKIDFRRTEWIITKISITGNRRCRLRIRISGSGYFRLSNGSRIK
jgi:ABC-type multidrug transport system ATPase subunit